MRSFLLSLVFLQVAVVGQESLRQAFLPIAFLSPENGIGVGGKYIVSPPETHFINRYDLHAYVTTRAQFEVKAHLRSKVNPVVEPRLTVEGFATPYSYYGPGNEPSVQNQKQALVYEPRGGRAMAEVLFNHALSINPGTRARLMRLRLAASAQGVQMAALGDNLSNEARDALLPPNSAGREGGWHDFYESTLEYDSRDEEDLPTRGLHLGLRFGHSSPMADFDFGKGEVFAAAYAMPHEKIEWAGKVVQRSAFGPAPFYELPVLGDRKMLRGIPDRRLRDAHAQALQTEWRYTFKLALPLIARAFGDTWQVAAFGELGRVSGGIQQIWQETWHPSAGLGGRLIVHHRLGALRGDIGFSEYGYGLYVDFNQAF